MKLSKAIAVAALILIVGGATTFWWNKSPAQTSGRGGGRGGDTTPPLVFVAPIAVGRVDDVLEAVGSTRASESITITPRTSGIVQAIHFNEGTNVEKGALLVELDSAELQANLAAAKAQVAQAVAQREQITQQLTRGRQLTDSGAVTQARIDELESQQRGAAAAIQTAQARQSAADVQLKDTSVRAPFSGRLGLRTISVGAYVDPRTPLTTLDDLSELRLDFTLSETDVPNLKVGASVRATTTGMEKPVEGKVLAIDSRSDTATRTVRVTASLPNPQQTLRAGQFLNVTAIVAQRAEALLIPEEALVGTAQQQFVFVVTTKDNAQMVERRSVTLGGVPTDRAGWVEIRSGLKPDDRVVVRGTQRLRTNQVVRVAS
jgi:membrane fusion protein, multidrug efflux system